MALEDVAKRIIDNSELKTLLTNYMMSGSLNPKDDSNLSYYENLVNFQLQECKGKIEEIGYQVGEPWAGRIKTAPILFVSRALGFKVDEICPRYVCDNSGIHGIACTGKVFENGSVTGESMSVNGVIDWCNERFDKAALKGNEDSLYISRRSGKGNGVKANLYWGSLKKNFEFLLSDDFKEALRDKFAGIKGGYLRELMKYVSCTSVIPFKIIFNRTSTHKDYKDYFLAEKVFKHYWKTFAEEIISLSGAKIIVLVGRDDVRGGNEILHAFEKSDKFVAKRLISTERSKASKRGKNIIKLYEWEDRLIVSVGINQGGMRNFSRYFWKRSNIIKTLRAKVKILVEDQYSFSSNS